MGNTSRRSWTGLEVKMQSFSLFSCLLLARLLLVFGSQSVRNVGDGDHHEEFKTLGNRDYQEELKRTVRHGDYQEEFKILGRRDYQEELVKTLGIRDDYQDKLVKNFEHGDYQEFKTLGNGDYQEESVKSFGHGDYQEEFKTLGHGDQEEQPAPCNPSSDKFCLARNPALAGDMFEPFTSMAASPYFHYTTCPRGVQHTSEALQLTLNKRYDNPSITSNFYILYGKVEADIQGAPGQGVISSMYLQSDDLDEIDVVEIFGGNGYTVQSNFFIKGNVTTYDRGDYYAVPSGPPMDRFYRYGCEWTPDRISWSIDGVVIRVVDRHNPYGIPESPMALKFSLWAGGDESNEVGTIEWAGGRTDYSGVPYVMRVKNVMVTDYSTGSEYCYGNSIRLNKWVDLTARQGIVAAKLAPADTIAETKDELAFLSEQEDEEVELVYEYIDENGETSTQIYISNPKATAGRARPKNRKKPTSSKLHGKKIGDGPLDREKRFLQYGNETAIGSTNESSRHQWSTAIITYISLQMLVAFFF